VGGLDFIIKIVEIFGRMDETCRKKEEKASGCC
jgi:hypothetical protein